MTTTYRKLHFYLKPSLEDLNGIDRECLRCGKLFNINSRFIRLCNDCKNLESNRGIDNDSPICMIDAISIMDYNYF